MLLRFLLIISVIINYNIRAQDDRRDFDSELNYQSSAIDDVKKEASSLEIEIKDLLNILMIKATEIHTKLNVANKQKREKTA